MKAAKVRISEAVVAGVRQIKQFHALLVIHRPFRWAWMGSTFSMLSTRTLGVTYPLLAFTITDSSAWIGWVMFASTVPGLLCYIPAGALIDRLGPRRVLVWSETGRALLVAGLCAVMFSGSLQISHLMALALAEGVFSVLTSVAETALIPRTVDPDDVGLALSMHETTLHGVVLAGRPLGGLLYGIGSIVPFAVNAGTFLFAALVLRRLPAEWSAEAAPREKLLSQIRSGLSELWHHRFLRWATIITALTNLMVQCLIVVFLSVATAEALHPVLVGMVLAAAGVGGVIGAFISPIREQILLRIERKTSRREWATRLTRRMGLSRRHRSMMLAHVCACAAALGLTLVFGQTSPAFAAALLVIGLAGGLSNVTVRTVLSRVPAEKNARVVSASRLGTYSAVALGPLLATLLFTGVEPYISLFVLFVLMLLLAVVTSLRGIASSAPAASPGPPSIEGL
ncbi:MFS transporter [Nonomuraea sp. NPDC049714]|uniref:MFS transporter n=1 Tax=Nonomuraea sp. NPDC049714 TaxID=3364357 RepID=UPI003787BEAE